MGLLRWAACALVWCSASAGVAAAQTLAPDRWHAVPFDTVSSSRVGTTACNITAGTSPYNSQQQIEGAGSYGEITGQSAYATPQGNIGLQNQIYSQVTHRSRLGPNDLAVSLTSESKAGRSNGT